MTLIQALALANLLISWELESPAVQPPPPAWEYELKEAQKTISQAITSPPAGDFFLSADTKRRGRESKLLTIGE